MSANPAWTPAPRPGIVPLHPYGFGVILGRSFTALRQNPGVLLGFALGVQVLAYIVLILATGAVAFASFSRLDTVTPGSDEYDAITAGSTALTVIVGGLLTLATGALTVIVQGVVVSEVTAAVVAEKRPLRALWRRVRPVAWRLLGYSFLVLLALAVVIGAVALAVIAISAVLLPVGVVLGVLAVLGAIPLYAWLSTKLSLVPAVIITEHARMTAAIARSWRLTRRRFWSTFGVLAIVSLTFGAVAQIVGIPLQFVAIGFTTVLSPTGDPDVGSVVAILVIGILTQVITLLVQCMALIVQSTAITLIYVDARMRHEGLDMDLSAYVEQRDAGRADLPDPYTLHIGRDIAPRPTAPYAPPPGGYPPPPYAAPAGPAASPGVTPPPPYSPSAPAAPPYAAPPYAAAPPASPTAWAPPTPTESDRP
ncbi:glycerophosphoryl diester phosphodiesterase membrane domain-containing protein [Microbacterium sp. NPDC091313]